MLVRVAGTIDQGRVCIGALDESQHNWLVPAQFPKREIVVATADNRRITIVFANCMPALPAPTRTRFTLESISYGELTAAEGARP
jgi:hypothetical protein